MPTAVLSKSGPARDEEGFLLFTDDWSPALAEAIAEEEGLDLDPERREVVLYVRDYYERNLAVPELGSRPARSPACASRASSCSTSETGFRTALAGLRGLRGPETDRTPAGHAPRSPAGRKQCGSAGRSGPRRPRHRASASRTAGR
jgi:hypothetical protein